MNQFDAARLDVEMSAMLKEQLVKVFSLMKVLSLLTMLIFVLLEACTELVLSVLMPFLHISQDSYSNTSLNLMLSSSSSSGGFQFGLTNLPLEMH